MGGIIGNSAKFFKKLKNFEKILKNFEKIV